MNITIFDDSKLPFIDSINKHLKNLQAENLDILKYLEKNDMDYEKTYKYLLDNKDEEKFIIYYEKFQFLFKVGWQNFFPKLYS